jgi:hypothetical protein
VTSTFLRSWKVSAFTPRPPTTAGSMSGARLRGGGSERPGGWFPLAARGVALGPLCDPAVTDCRYWAVGSIVFYPWRSPMRREVAGAELFNGRRKELWAHYSAATASSP